MKLLIADDSELIRSRLTILLKEIADSIDIQSVGSLKELYLNVGVNFPDLLILDIHLADGNSIQSIEMLKKCLPKMRIAMLSNDATSFNRKVCLRAGADWFFDKFTEIELVEDVVRSVVNVTDV